MDNNANTNMEQNNIILYKSNDGLVSVNVLFHDETFWLTQKIMSELFSVEVHTINEHLKNIFLSEELQEVSTIRKSRIVQKEGNRDVSRELTFYNLDAIIAVGYRVNSKSATHFRRWATASLREYIVKGFILNDEMLKNGRQFGKDYFQELLERIREIRMSERRLYLQITDIFATASDYNAKNDLVREFFAFIQNKLHYAITGKTAAEIIYGRADKNLPNMGLNNWKLAPEGKILSTDVTVAKNYLNEDELRKLRLAVTAFLDIAQSRAERGIPTDMKQWLGIMDGYLDLNEYPKLRDAGQISKKDAETKALNEYSIFRVKQDEEYIGDFEKAAINELIDHGNKLKP